jgi:23S rRNA (cytidine1920-2'-O)/16S rRNA (cytidine1409-2'-O)-methyltransferase
MPPEAVGERVDLVTIDVSFISLKVVVPAVLQFLKDEASILALVKPQFEVGKGKVGKGGVVRDAAQHHNVVAELTHFFSNIGLVRCSLIPSPILGPKGNKEYLMHLKCDKNKQQT